MFIRQCLSRLARQRCPLSLGISHANELIIFHNAIENEILHARVFHLFIYHVKLNSKRGFYFKCLTVQLSFPFLSSNFKRQVSAASSIVIPKHGPRDLLTEITLSLLTKFCNLLSCLVLHIEIANYNYCVTPDFFTLGGIPKDT